MATVLTRKRKNGSLAFQAQIVIKRNGVIAYREQQTFDKKQAAFASAEKRESELNKPGGLEQANADDPTLADVIDVYIRDIGAAKIGKTKAQVLATTKGYPIAKLRCSAIGSADISSFAQSLKVQPQTRLNYLSHLSAIFTIARPAWGFPLDQQAMRDALKPASEHTRSASLADKFLASVAPATPSAAIRRSSLSTWRGNTPVRGQIARH